GLFFSHHTTAPSRPRPRALTSPKAARPYLPRDMTGKAHAQQYKEKKAKERYGCREVGAHTSAWIAPSGASAVVFAEASSTSSAPLRFAGGPAAVRVDGFLDTRVPGHPAHVVDVHPGD